MESNDKLKEIEIKNRRCYSFNDIIEIEDFDFDNISLDEKLHRYISYRHFIKNFDWFKTVVY